LNATNPERISTCLVGQLRMLGIPNLNVVYEDETGAVLIHDIEGKGELLVVHAEVLPTTNREILGHYLEVMDMLFEQLKERGITEVEAWINSDEEMRYAQFFGFDEFLGELMVHDQPCMPSVFRLRKRLI
jgi:hypothetical protein